MHLVNNLVVVLLCLAASLGLAASARTRDVGAGRALHQAAAAATEGNVAPSTVGQRFTQTLTWAVKLGGANPGDPYGSVTFTDGQQDISSTRMTSLSVSVLGPYLDADNKTIGNWICMNVQDGTPLSLQKIASAKYAGAAIDSVTVKAASLPLACEVYINDVLQTNASCTSRGLVVRSRAKCAINRNAKSNMCSDTDAVQSRTTKGGSCEVNAASSSVMVVVECPPGRRLQYAPTSVEWSRTDIELRP